MTVSTRVGKCRKFLRQNLLLLLTIVGVGLGLIVGFSVRIARPTDDTLMWLGLPGQLYLRLLKMMIVPIVVCSVITGTSSMDPKVNGKISLTAFIFIFLSNMTGAILGVAVFLIFKPGLIFACTLIGIAASSLKEKGKPFIKFFSSASDIILLVVRKCLWTTPVGVFSLIAVTIAGIQDLASVFKELGVFIAAVVVGIAFQQIVVMPAILFALTRRNPLRVWIAMSKPWLISFAAATTVVVIPELFYCCEQKLKIDKRVTRFVIPFSVTLSANGSAVFIACSCLFISNLTHHTPEASGILIIGLLTTVTTLALPTVPSASIFTIVMILTSMNIPVEAIALLLAVDWLLDRFRTTSTTVSHTHCAAVTYHFCRNSLQARTVRVQDEDIISIQNDGECGKLLHFKTTTTEEPGIVTINIEKQNVVGKEEST